MTKTPKPQSMQAHTERLTQAQRGNKVPVTSEGAAPSTGTHSSTKPGGYLVHPNAAGKVGSVPVAKNPNRKKPTA